MSIIGSRLLSPQKTQAQGHKLASGTINGINRRGMEGVKTFEAESGFHYMDSLCEWLDLVESVLHLGLAASQLKWNSVQHPDNCIKPRR